MMAHLIDAQASTTASQETASLGPLGPLYRVKAVLGPVRSEMERTGRVLFHTPPGGGPGNGLGTGAPFV